MAYVVDVSRRRDNCAYCNEVPLFKFERRNCIRRAFCRQSTRHCEKNMSEGFFGVNVIFQVEFYIEYCPYTVHPRVNLSKENRPFPYLEQFQNTRSLVFSFRLYIHSEVLKKLNYLIDNDFCCFV